MTRQFGGRPKAPVAAQPPAPTAHQREFSSIGPLCLGLVPLHSENGTFTQQNVTYKMGTLTVSLDYNKYPSCAIKLVQPINYNNHLSTITF